MGAVERAREYLAFCVSDLGSMPQVGPIAVLADLVAEIDAGMAKDAARYRFCVEHGVFPALANDGQAWVMFVAVTSLRRSTFIGDTPSEAIDAAREGGNGSVE